MIPDIEKIRRKTSKSKAVIVGEELERLREIMARSIYQAADSGWPDARVITPSFHKETIQLMVKELEAAGYRCFAPGYTESIVVSWSPASPENSAE